MTGALSSVRVLDLSRILAGPWASQLLGDLGAEVIKVERPGTGDDTRGWGPPFLKDHEGKDTSTASYYLSANRSKKSIAINMAHPEGAALIVKLAAHSDVVIENFKVGGLKKYGLDYESLRQHNPGLIYCSITGFGQTGPYAERAGYDFMIQGMGGLMSVTGLPDNEAGGGPVKVGVALADVLTGLYASNAILAALFHRKQTGEGQYIDMALLDVQVASLANQALNYLTTGISPQRLGNAHPNIVPYEAFQTADGHMILAVGNDAQFARFCQEANHPALSADPRFTTNTARVEHRHELIPLLKPLMLKRTTSDWIKALNKLSVPCGPINNLAEVFADPQVIARKMQISVEHPDQGAIPLVANPIRFSRTPVHYEQAPPALGEHTEAVLKTILGIDQAEIARLKEKDVL